MAVVAILVGTIFQGEASSVTSPVVDDTPRTDTPQVLDGEVRDLAKAGGRIIVAGTFTQVTDTATQVTHNQAYLFAYDVETGALDLNFLPTLDNEVNAVQPSADGSTVHVGGRFKDIDGVDRLRLAELRLSDGSVVTGFRADTDAKVTTLAMTGDRLFVGGDYQMIGGFARSRLAEVNATTGSVSASFDLPVTEGTGEGGGSSVQALDVTSDGTTLLSVHNDKWVDGLIRTGVALIDISGTTATVSPWQTLLYEDNRCLSPADVTKVRDATFAPDDSYFVVVSMGSDGPPTCDTAVAFPTTGGDGVEPIWVSRHFDSLESVAISYTAIYVGGHFQWQEAPGSADPWPGDTNTNYGEGGAAALGSEVVYSDQVGALHPVTGKALDWDASASGFRGVLALEVVDDGLLLGHDGTTISGLALGRHGYFRGETGPPGSGWWLLEQDGTLYEFGSALPYQSATTNDAVDVATVPEGTGLWILDTDGVVHVRGAATNFGNVNMGALDPGEEPSAISVRATADGYWVFTDRGRVLSFGAAPNYGGVETLSLNSPIIASVASPSGLGYWMVAGDGGVFSFGDAGFYGSTGAMTLDEPVVGMVPDPDGSGYWLIAADGGVFAFAAPFNGSVPQVLGGTPLNEPVVGGVQYGNGYVLVAADGSAFTFSNLPYQGGLGANPPDEPIVAIAAYPVG